MTSANSDYRGYFYIEVSGRNYDILSILSIIAKLLTSRPYGDLGRRISRPLKNPKMVFNHRLVPVENVFVLYVCKLLYFRNYVADLCVPKYVDRPEGVVTTG